MQNAGTKEEKIITTDDRYKEKWGWYPILFELANNDILRMNEVSKVPIYQALTFLSFKQDKFILDREKLNKK
ncbi:MAG: hypothetical protein Unbinned3987contig1001_40 [Prokaryotic dsDNA virus sp.]|nr:MAG: hypothetical protein Unbinned3987contig1001_40 [Prokaryotic dsDNA virus sp.]